MAVIYNFIEMKNKRYPVMDVIHYDKKRLSIQSNKQRKIRKKRIVDEQIINIEDYIESINNPEGVA